MKPLVIIHGWSDEADSFIPLAKALQEELDRPVETLWLGNYITLDDDVTMRDLVAGLARAWKDMNLPTKSRSVDAIVHSTGGLVIRDWLQSHYVSQDLKPPINNLVMLAPANFGSPLAHKGRAFYGRVFKGFTSSGHFQTGTHILRALEIASPYTWDLAWRDRLTDRVFSATGVRCTVIVGNTGYDGIQAIANEDGSDGTVYVSTANLDCAALQIDFSSNPQKPTIRARQPARGETAFLVLDGHNHSSVALKEPEHPDNSVILDGISSALAVSNAEDFGKWVEDCARRTALVAHGYGPDTDKAKHAYQNTVVRVRDDHGFDVEDYVIEFYQDHTDSHDLFASFFNTKALRKVHAYKGNTAYRSFMIDCTVLHDRIDQAGEHLRISLSAMPNLTDTRNVVGYRSFGNEEIGAVALDPEGVRNFFRPNRTLFVEIVLKREQQSQIFELKTLDAFGK